jgi:hypothetical protein
MGSLCVSLGSSTVQVADANAHVQWLVSVVKMVNMLEGCITEEQRSVVHFFLCAKGPCAKDIHREIFPVYGGKCLSRKAVHNWVANVSLMMKR